MTKLRVVTIKYHKHDQQTTICSNLRVSGSRRVRRKKLVARREEFAVRRVENTWKYPIDIPIDSTKWAP